MTLAPDLGCDLGTQISAFHTLSIMCSLPFGCSVVPGETCCFWHYILQLSQSITSMGCQTGAATRSFTLAFASCNFSRMVSRNVGTDALDDMLHLNIQIWREVKRARDQALPGATGPAVRCAAALMSTNCDSWRSKPSQQAAPRLQAKSVVYLHS